MSILIKNGLVLSLDEQSDSYSEQDVLVENGRIARIEERIPEATAKLGKVIDASDKLVVPGFVNAHVHSYDAYTRGLYENLPLEIWFPYASMTVRRPLSKREIYVRTLLVATEMLRSGITTGYDDVTLFPLEEESLDAVMTAYRDAGIRAVVGVSLLNKPVSQTLPYLDDILPEKVRQEVNEPPPLPDSELLGFCRNMIERWSGKEDRLHVALAPSAPQRCTDEFLLAIDDLSSQHHLPWNTHVLETKVQVVTGREFYGKSIVEHLAELDLLSDRLAIIHGVWLAEHDIELLSDHGTSVIHNPVSNLKLGSGIAPLRQILGAGVNVALGSDNSGAVDTTNMFETLKFAALLPEILGTYVEEWDGARTVLNLATSGGARSLLLQDEIGSLAVGQRADIVLMDLKTHAFTPLNDPVRQLVYNEVGQSVDTVLVNGEIVVEKRQLVTVDEEAILEEARQIGKELQREHAKAAGHARMLRPYVEEIYARSVSQDVGMNRLAMSPAS